MSKQYHVFISSKMVELAEERHQLQSLLPTLGNDIVDLKAWVFEEDAPASNQNIREVYLDALKSSALYIGLFWNEYGEYTLDEFQKATEWGIDRHIYVKNVNADQRDDRLAEFLEAQSDVISGVTPKWFETTDDLMADVAKSIEVWLDDHIQRRPGDSSATLAEFADDIPDLPKKLIGRTDIYERTREYLEDGSQVLLQGFGGTGKTAIAASIAADWLDDDMGDVLWLRTGSENEDTILEALAAPFESGQDVASASDSREKAKAVRRILSNNNISLVVFDDVWDGNALNHVMRAVPRRVPVLVTARQRYALDDIIEVGRMLAEGALQLLEHHSRLKLKSDDSAAELCLQLGYHAFALEVAGKTLKVDQISPEELLDRIQNVPHDMTMPGDFAEEGRSSITELLDTSVYALDESTRQTFLAFGSLFAPEATVELIANILEKDKAIIEDNLLTLQRRGLAERNSIPNTDKYYYRVHNLAYSYAKNLATAHGRAPDNYLDVIASFVSRHQNNLAVLDVTRNNWMGAAIRADEQEQGRIVIGIMQPLVGHYMEARGHTLSFLDLIDAAIDYADEIGAEYDDVRQTLLSRRGNAYLNRNDLQSAVIAYQSALDIANQREMKDRQVILLSMIAAVWAELGEAGTETYLNAAFKIADDIDDDYLRGFVLEKQAYNAQLQGDFESTREFSARQAEIADRIGDKTTQIFALNNIGAADNLLGQAQAALESHQKMLQLAEDEQNPLWKAQALQGLGEDYHTLGNRDLAEQNLRQALQIFQEHGIRANVEEIEAFMQQHDYIS